MKIKVSIILMLVLVGVSNLFAQTVLPRASQRQSVSQTVGDTTVSIVYHRPNIKAREVWGGIVPYGEVWRTGANAATQLKLDRPIEIGGHAVAAGGYTLWTIPSAAGWKLVLNSETGQWGTAHDADESLAGLHRVVNEPA